MYMDIIFQLLGRFPFHGWTLIPIQYKEAVVRGNPYTKKQLETFRCFASCHNKTTSQRPTDVHISHKISQIIITVQ